MDSSSCVPASTSRIARPPPLSPSRNSPSFLGPKLIQVDPQQDNEPAFIAALAADLSRPDFETIVAELNPLKGEINEAYDHLDKWAKPVKVKTSAVWGLAKATVYSEPKGAFRRSKQLDGERGADPR